MRLGIKKEWMVAYLFILPNLVGLLIFMVIPTINSVAYSFTDWNMIRNPVFSGLNNYKELFTDQLFWKTLGNTSFYVFIKVPINIVISLILAVLLNNKMHGRTTFRAILFMPMIASSVSVALLWQPLFDPTLGFLNKLFSFIGLGPFPWLLDPHWAMPCVIMVALWKEIGYYMVMFLAGLQGISKTYYEAAKIDGANGVQSFFKITIPLVSSTTFFVLIISVIGSFQIFDLTTVLTNGGPANATNTLIMYVYQAGFRFFRMGYASALACVLFIIVLVFTMIQNRQSKRWVHY
jgi:multiple sugar transport system permease protein